MSLAASSTDFLLKEYMLAGPQMQMFKAIIMLPWALKPLVGILSDSFPIFGYRKGPYIVLATSLGISGYAMIGWGASLSMKNVVFCLFCGNIHISVSDLLTEAAYSEKLRMNSKSGPDLVTYVWGGVTFGSLVAVLISGRLLESWGPHKNFQICAIFSASVVAPTVMNFLEEVPMNSEMVASNRKLMLTQEREVVGLSILVASCVLAMVVTGLLMNDIEISFRLCLLVSLTILCSFTMFFRPDIGLVNAFFFIQSSCALSIGGATFFFSPTCLKNIPEDQTSVSSFTRQC